jgi:hypothetical protein
MNRILARAWRRWLTIVEALGNLQMILILSLVYWTMLALVALPYKLFADPMSHRSAHRMSWVSRPPVTDVLKSAKKQG